MMEKKEKTPRGFYVEKGSFFAHAAVTVLVLSVAARLLGTMNLWGDMQQLLIHIALPLGSALLFILFILALGRIALWTTILPVLGGAAFFVLSIFDQGPGWPLFICIALSFLAAFVYTATLTGMLRTKWIAVLVFAMILAYQVVFCAIPAFGDIELSISFAEGMKLLSSMGLVFAMFCACLAMRRRKRATPDLPKIKDPKVVPPAAETSAAPAEAPDAEEIAPSAGSEAPSSAETLESVFESADAAPVDTSPADAPAEESFEQ